MTTDKMLRDFISAVFELEAAAQNVIDGVPGAHADLIDALKEFGDTDMAMKSRPDNEAFEAAKSEAFVADDEAKRERRQAIIDGLKGTAP